MDSATTMNEGAITHTEEGEVEGAEEAGEEVGITIIMVTVISIMIAIKHESTHQIHWRL
jgi:hypothetical protein